MVSHSGDFKGGAEVACGVFEGCVERELWRGVCGAFACGVCRRIGTGTQRSEGGRVGVGEQLRELVDGAGVAG
jgi:hypothetical protein